MLTVFISIIFGLVFTPTPNMDSQLVPIEVVREIELPEILPLEVEETSEAFLLPYICDEPEIAIEEPVELTMYDFFNQEEIDLLARVVMSEASLLSIEGKQAVAEVILNRVYDDRWPDSVQGVVYQKNQFSTANNGEPDIDCYEAVRRAIIYDVFPDDMYWFRLNYSQYGYEYVHIGNTWFSTEVNIYELL